MSRSTPGPWRWELNQSTKTLQLTGKNSITNRNFDIVVMDFARYGMSGASCRFNNGERGMNIMLRADELSSVVEGREHDSSWFKTIDHPDANLIEAAPDLLGALDFLLSVLSEDSHPADFASAICVAESAIRKAKGE